MGAAIVHPFHHADTGTWSYVVADPATAQALVIDPVLDFEASSGRVSTASAQALLACASSRGYQLTAILETHAHADHLSAAQWLRQRTGAPVAIGKHICDVQSRFKPVFNFPAEFATDGSQFDRLLGDGERFPLGKLDCRVIATPGHTSDGVSYLIGDDAVFIGDTLFMPDAGTARCDFPGGDATTLYASVQRLYALPDATRVFVCHDYPRDDRELHCESSIGAEKAANMMLPGAGTLDAFIAVRSARDATLKAPTLLYPALQVNLRAGELPAAESNGVRYLKLPLQGSLSEDA